MYNSNIPEEASAELDQLFSNSAAQIMRTEDAAAFTQWFSQYAFILAPSLAQQIPNDAEMRRSFLLNMARVIWNSTPLPSNKYRPKPQPKPERNHPCPCGSGHKYKHCCAATEMPDNALPAFSMLLYVLDNTPLKLLPSLPYSHLNPDELNYIAHVWIERGRAQDAVKLLEGLFANISKLDDSAEGAFDTLLNCYDLLDKPRKKQQLLDLGVDAPNKRLRVAAMQRICSIHADRGDYPRAWALFQTVQRLAPNDPSLSHLEVIMLSSQGEYARAAERAKFWIAHLSRDKQQDHTQLIHFLSKAASQDFGAAMFDVVQDIYPAAGEFAKLLAMRPAPVTHYLLEPINNEETGPLIPDAKLARLEDEWMQVFAPVIHNPKPTEWAYAQNWLGWLDRHPDAWHSFVVLSDITTELENTPSANGLEASLLLPLLNHAEALLRHILKHHHAENMRMEWGWMENRPALRLIETLASYTLFRQDVPRAIDLMEWLVLTLNPKDNQGIREKLLHAYLRAARVAPAILLAEGYLNDMASMQYGHVLACYLAGRGQDASTLLQQARQHFPEVYKMLISPNPRKPATKDGYVTIGGKDEAWFYRQNYLTIWQQSDALTWLRSQATVKPSQEK